MENRSALSNLEWVVVSKRQIYAVIALLTLALGAGLYLWRYGNPFGSTQDNSPVTEGARFDIFEGEVRVIRALTRETIIADARTRLYPGDVVQTLEAGHASILLVDGSVLTIRPNSVLTIAENRSASPGRDGHVRVNVERGEVEVSTERQVPETSNIVETMLSENRLSRKTVASFDVHDDHSEEIRVSVGAIESSMSGGKTTIHGGEYVALSRTGDVRRREQLLDAPIPYAPSNLERLELRPGSHASIALQWTHPMAATEVFYRVEIATSPFFVKAGIIFERDHLITPKLTITDLRPGNYFWRVQAVSQTGQSSGWSEPQKFTAVISKVSNEVQIAPRSSR